MILVDTNIVLRYLLNDHQEMSAKAKEIIQSGPVMVLTQIIAETVYVLGGVYHVSRPDIASAIQSLMALNTVTVEHEPIIADAINEFSHSKLDLVDLLLLAHHRISGAVVETFDKALQRKLQTEQNTTEE